MKARLFCIVGIIVCLLPIIAYHLQPDPELSPDEAKQALVAMFTKYGQDNPKYVFQFDRAAVMDARIRTDNEDWWSYGVTIFMHKKTYEVRIIDGREEFRWGGTFEFRRAPLADNVGWVATEFKPMRSDTNCSQEKDVPGQPVNALVQ